MKLSNKLGFIRQNLPSKISGGFTIIETMLFLAISGALIAAVLMGTGTAINAQRYRDSVTSLQSNLQQQYSDAANVSNDRNSNWSCDSTGKIVEGSTPIGQSDCLLLGKYITINADGSQLLFKSVVGYDPGNLSPAANDVEAIKQLKIQISTIDGSIETYDTEWGSSVVKPGNDEALAFSVLIVRSPLSGVIRTFIDPAKVYNDQDIASLVNLVALSTSVKMCLNSKGLFTGPRMAVVIDAGATSGSAVETLGDKSGC